MRRTPTYFVSSVTASAVESNQPLRLLGIPCMRRTSATSLAVLRLPQ
ncbi:MAG: hypothetical protein MJA31_07050 [Clostridia bacterium]|nr:hypothetical protein [Clostridia bacterium]